jgi:hypothetical protein
MTAVRPQDSERRPPPRRRARACALVVLLLAVATSALLPQPSALAGRKASGGIRLLGALPEPPADGRTFSYVVQVDPVERRLYYLWRRGTDFYLDEYDITPAIPRLLREVYVGTYDEVPIDSASPYTMQLDTENRRLLMLGQNHHGSIIRIVDLETFKVAGTWDVGSVMPGFVAQGLTYSAPDKRIYLVGSFSGNAYGTRSVVVPKPAQAAMVVALDATVAPAESPSVAWARPVPQCQQVMDTAAVGALIARSKHQDALYFACLRADPWPGESGVVRMWIDPAAAQQDAAGFEVDFFPISGSYTGVPEGIVGMAAFDYATDRVFVQSLAEATPGAWVLDGRISAWVGFLAAPDNNDRFLGLDQSSGHYYIASIDPVGDGGYLLASNARSTPIPQGEVFKGFGATSFIVTDPVTHRLFVQVSTEKLGLETDAARAYIVLKDETALARPPSPLDYDALTSDVDEGPGTITNFSGGINGFGARAVLVGGYGGLLSASGQPMSLGQVRSGDRGLTVARVPSVDLRNGGAAATAQALVSDTNTEAEMNDAGAGDWPWAPTTCLDGNGTQVENSASAPGGDAAVVCDLAKERAEASAVAGPVVADGIGIGSSSFNAATWRDEKKGIVTSTTAIAKDLELSVPAGNTVSIAKVTSNATTVAHGRPDSAKASWERVMSGIEITDADGKIVQRVGECSTSVKEDTCGPIVDAINNALSLKLRVSLPRARVLVTPKGAFAGVEQSAADFYQGQTVNNQGTTFAGEAASRAVPGLEIVAFNDSVEKSRLVVQVAAVQASSIYTNSPQTDPPVAPPVDAPPAVDTDAKAAVPAGDGSIPAGGSGVPASGGGDGAASAPAGELAPVAAPIPEGVLAFLTRGPAEALLFAGLWMLFGAAGLGVYRRRALLQVVRGPAS